MEVPEFLKPIIDELPPAARDFMNDGGWVAAVAVAGLIVLLILWILLRAMFRRPPPKPKSEEPSLTEDLSTYPPPPGKWGDQRVTVQGLGARLRLVVVAPLGLEAGEIDEDGIATLLDRAVPGLGPFLKGDQPRVRIWPTQLSHQGFVAAFRRNTLVPEAERDPSRWVLLMGRVILDRRPLGIGLAFLCEKENMIGRVGIDQPHQWAEIVRIKTV